MKELDELQKKAIEEIYPTVSDCFPLQSVDWEARMNATREMG